MPDGERFAGKPVGLPAVSFGTGRTTQLATADRIDVRLENPPPTEVAYELKSHRGATAFPPVIGVLRIKNSPRGLAPNFEEPLVRTQLSEPIVIEAVVPQTLVIGVSPNGLVWMPAPGAPAGMEDDHGRYLLLNGQKWHNEAGMPQLPILLGVRDTQIHLLWARPLGDGPHNPDRVSTNVQKVPIADLTSVIVQNRAGDPTRVALAISFHPSKTIIPLMPPRSSPVLESHWPLDDSDPATAADRGPAGRIRPNFVCPCCSGRTRQWAPARPASRSLPRRFGRRPHRLVLMLRVDQTVARRYHDDRQSHEQRAPWF